VHASQCWHFRVTHKAANCWLNDSSCVHMYLFIIGKILDQVLTELALFDRVQLLRVICDGSRIYSALLHLCSDVEYIVHCYIFVVDVIGHGYILVMDLKYIGHCYIFVVDVIGHCYTFVMDLG
jgi:hypothetical protein